MRGEHVTIAVTELLLWGSSPHARGAPVPTRRSPVESGIIPACAGSTTIGLPLLEVVRDHPRMRGEHPSLKAHQSASWGSSPHARGALNHRRRVIDVLRIIPACAGSTTACSFTIPTQRDHPRMRGEHFTRLNDGSIFWGSSPHARGALNHRRCVIDVLRIIPACAGSTRYPERLSAGCRDHPRMRGEHHRRAQHKRILWGSSPHARGAQGALLQG